MTRNSVTVTVEIYLSVNRWDFSVIITFNAQRKWIDMNCSRYSYCAYCILSFLIYNCRWSPVSASRPWCSIPAVYFTILINWYRRWRTCTLGISLLYFFIILGTNSLNSTDVPLSNKQTNNRTITCFILYNFIIFLFITMQTYTKLINITFKYRGILDDNHAENTYCNLWSISVLSSSPGLRSAVSITDERSIDWTVRPTIDAPSVGRTTNCSTVMNNINSIDVTAIRSDMILSTALNKVLPFDIEFCCNKFPLVRGFPFLQRVALDSISLGAARSVVLSMPNTFLSSLYRPVTSMTPSPDWTWVLDYE